LLISFDGNPQALNTPENDSDEILTQLLMFGRHSPRKPADFLPEQG
jgi:hypothetical protein